MVCFDADLINDMAASEILVMTILNSERMSFFKSFPFFFVEVTNLPAAFCELPVRGLDKIEHYKYN